MQNLADYLAAGFTCCRLAFVLQEAHKTQKWRSLCAPWFTPDAGGCAAPGFVPVFTWGYVRVGSMLRPWADAEASFARDWPFADFGDGDGCVLDCWLRSLSAGQRADFAAFARSVR